MRTDFVSLAVSKDEARTNLRSPYRDVEHTVATDGHRMHIRKELKIDAPVPLPDGETFPHWQTVIPNDAPLFWATVTVTTDALKALKRFRDCVLKTSAPVVIKNSRGKKDTIGAQYSVALRFGRDIHIQRTVKAFDAGFAGSLQMTLETKESSGSFSDIVGIDIRYLHDAVAGMHAEIGAQSAPVTIEVYSTKAPIVIRCGGLSAVIMPMRLSE